MMMTPEQQAVFDAQAELERLEAEYLALGAEERQIQDRLKAISARQARLRPWNYRSGNGEIALAQARLAQAKIMLADASKPRLEIRSSSYGGDVQVVLVKVTDKRIYVREIGSEREHHISKDGKTVPYGWQVDMDALLKFAGCAQEGKR